MFELIYECIVVFLMGYIPGRVLVHFAGKALDLTRTEKTVSSFGLSFFLYYLVGFAGYVYKLNAAWLHASTTGIFVLVFVFLVIKSKFIDRDEIKLLGYLAGAFALVISLQALLPIYNGGGWMGDWFEHYQRMLFYHQSFRLDYKFLDVYLLPARPPLFNIVTYYYQSLLGDSFWVFQVVCTFMNIVVLLPIYLVLKKIFKIKSGHIFLIAAGVFLLNPTFTRNLTYTWTRHLTNYYVILGVYFYLKGRGKPDFRYIYTAFALLGMGQLTHYSAVVYLAAIILDYIVISGLRFRESIKPFIISMFILVFVVSSWYLWSLYYYGFEGTFMSNTTYQSMEGNSFWDNILKDWLNFRNTVIPYFIYPELRPVAGFFVQISKTGFLYDTLLGFYSASFIGNFTITLSFVLLFTAGKLYTAVRNTIREAYRKSGIKNLVLQDTVFWIGFIFISLVIGIRVNAPQVCGCAHVSLQPLIVLVLCYIIKNLESVKSPVLKILIIAGMAIEAFIVIGARVLFEMPVDFSNRVFAGFFYGNYYWKLVHRLVFLYDKFQNRTVFAVIVIAGFIGLLAVVTKHLFNKKSIS